MLAERSRTVSRTYEGMCVHVPGMQQHCTESMMVEESPLSQGHKFLVYYARENKYQRQLEDASASAATDLTKWSLTQARAAALNGPDLSHKVTPS